MKNAISRILLAVCLFVSLWPAAAAGPDGQLPTPEPVGRVSPWVLSALDSGRSADLLVVLADQADLSAAVALSNKQARGRYVYNTLWEHAQRSQAPLRAWLDSQGVAYRSYYIVNLIHIPAADSALVETLARRLDVARIDANPAVYNAQPVSEPAALRLPETIQANLSVVGAPDVWNLGYTGQGIVLGGQDTGYEWNHPALINQYRGWDGATASHDYNWHDAIHENNPNTSPENECGYDSPVPCDDYGHGTHTMGIAVGDDGAGQQIGMAPGARWIGCRNMEDGWGTPATYLECFEFFLAPYPVGGDPGQGNPDLAPDVTNNSWSCPTYEGCAADTLQAAVEAQRAAGIMTVASAGNTGTSTTCGTVSAPPAIYDATYTIGRTDNYDSLAYSSSRGPVTVDGSNRPKPDLVAPGTSIYSSIPGATYGYMSGTSMSSPHVAGAVALLWSAAPALAGDISLTEDYLNASAKHIGYTACSSSGVPNNWYGWGRLDVYAAVQAAVSSGHLNGTVRDDQSNPLGEVSITAEAADYLWITASGADGSYSQMVPAGTYTLTAKATGFYSFAGSGVVVSAGVTTTTDIVLTALPRASYMPLLIRSNSSQ